MQDGLYSLLQLRKFVLHDVPNDIDVDRELVTDENITQTGDPLPVN